MKNMFLILFCSLAMQFINVNDNTNKSWQTMSITPIQATSYIVMEQSTNKIIEENNVHQTRSVASISKIMTAIVAIENVNLEDVVTIPKEINTVYGSMLYLKENDKIPIMDLLYGLMLRSGNDAAVSIAIHISKTVERFVDLMNQKAKILNMNNTIFKNPHGLDENDGGNISTAYDMALLHAYALNNPIYRQISSSKSYKNYKNKNRILTLCDYATGGKTGFTTKARRTLVTSAKQNDLELVIVTLNCGNDFYTHKNLYEYYFQEYVGVLALKAGKNYIDNYCLTVEKNYVFMVNKKHDNLYLKYDFSYKSKDVKIYLQDKYGYILQTLCVCLYCVPKNNF